VVYDSTWEKAASDALEHSDRVAAWAKNDHLGFKVRYLWRGSSRNYVPDYLIRFDNGKTLVLEIKGQDSEQNRAKRAAMDVWVQCVNQQENFGQWYADVVFDPAKLMDTLLKYSD
jgi:type III restriction enzyme